MAYDPVKKAEYYRQSRRTTILKNRYGITEDDYNAMFVKQSGKCAVCSTDFNGSARNMDVDHCHVSGRVRGLLCNNCNRGIGYLQDSPGLLLSAAAYLNQ